MRNKRAVYSAFMYSFIFGFSFLFTKITLGHVNSIFHLLGLRFLAAFVFMSILIFTGSVKVSCRKKKKLDLVLLAIIQPVIYFTFETLGISILTASQTGIMIACIPVFVLISAKIFLKEKTTLLQNFFILLSVTGAVVLNIGSLRFGSANGVLFLLAAVIAAAAFSILSRSLSPTYTSLEMTYVMMGTGAVVFNTIGIFNHNLSLYEYFKPFQDIRAVAGILYLGIFSSVTAFFLLNYTLSKIEASKTAVFANLTTVIAAAAGVIFLREPVLLHQAAGGIMILFGVYGLRRAYI